MLPNANILIVLYGTKINMNKFMPFASTSAEFATGLASGVSHLITGTNRIGVYPFYFILNNEQCATLLLLALLIMIFI